MLNALKVAGKDPRQVKLVTRGRAAALVRSVAVKLGIPRENIFVTDLAGAWSMKAAPELMDEDKVQFAPAHGPHVGRPLKAPGLSAGGAL
jgi:malate dehydrogenase (oxaloacetate-decarboxylating)(NADP+)